MHKICTGVAVLAILFFAPTSVFAQSESPFGFAGTATSASSTATTSASTTAADLSVSGTAAGIVNQRLNASENNLTRPEELEDKVAIISLFESRLVEEPRFFNLMAYWVQESVRAGVPANTVFLILLTPLLAFIVTLTRVVIGLPTLDMLVPIALAFALVAVGIEVGLLVLGAILVASYFSKASLSKLRIMFYPKRSLSMLFLAIAVFAALSVGVALEFERILSVSIFPILILMLLGDLIVSVQLHKSAGETLQITSTTIAIGVIGFVLATSTIVQNIIILYPETVLLVIPANIIVGRYFGLRATEMFRFKNVSD